MELLTKIAKKQHIILVSWQRVIAFDQWLISRVLMKRESTQKEKKPSSKESVFLRAPKN
jgi:hypothetical protein